MRLKEGDISAAAADLNISVMESAKRPSPWFVREAAEHSYSPTNHSQHAFVDCFPSVCPPLLCICLIADVYEDAVLFTK